MYYNVQHLKVSNRSIHYLNRLSLIGLLEREAGYTLDRSPDYRRADTQRDKQQHSQPNTDMILSGKAYDLIKCMYERNQCAVKINNQRK